MASKSKKRTQKTKLSPLALTKRPSSLFSALLVLAVVAIGVYTLRFSHAYSPSSKASLVITATGLPAQFGYGGAGTVVSGFTASVPMGIYAKADNNPANALWSACTPAPSGPATNTAYNQTYSSYVGLHMSNGTTCSETQAIAGANGSPLTLTTQPPSGWVLTSWTSDQPGCNDGACSLNVPLGSTAHVTANYKATGHAPDDMTMSITPQKVWAGQEFTVKWHVSAMSDGSANGFGCYEEDNGDNSDPWRGARPDAGGSMTVTAKGLGWHTLTWVCANAWGVGFASAQVQIVTPDNPDAGSTVATPAPVGNPPAELNNSSGGTSTTFEQGGKGGVAEDTTNTGTAITGSLSNKALAPAEVQNPTKQIIQASGQYNLSDLVVVPDGSKITYQVDAKKVGPLLDTVALANGLHFVNMTLTDSSGHQTLVTRVLSVNNQLNSTQKAVYTLTAPIRWIQSLFAR